MHLYDLNIQDDIFQFTPQTKQKIGDSYPDSVKCMAVSPDGRLAISGHEDGTIRLWDLDTD